MKKLFFILLIVSASASYGQEASSTKIFLIRHAQTVDVEGGERILSDEGLATANKWVSVLAAEPIEMIYSTDYLRTQATAKPIAIAKGNLAVISYDPENFDLQKLLSDARGKTILIVGHSGTTPTTVNTLLGEEKFQTIEANIHSNLYIVNYLSPDLVNATLIDVD